MQSNKFCRWQNFPQYKFADPSVYGNSFYLFRNHYFDMVGYGNHTPVMKRSMEAEFTEKLHSIAFRATKAECLDLPETTDVVQRVDLEPVALRAQTKYLFTGVGFVFTEAGGIVGVDIDHCRNEDGTFTEAAQAILDKYPSYTEISPSGAGLHIFYRGVMPGKGNKNSATGVEMYASARYFTMTGNRLEGTPKAITDGTQALPWIHENYIARKQVRKRKTKKTARRVVLSDEQVLEKARTAQNAEDFTVLWEGRWQDKFASQSEADFALCCALAFWTGRDREQMVSTSVSPSSTPVRAISRRSLRPAKPCVSAFSTSGCSVNLGMSRP